jgi:hypothetical protein
MKNFIFIIGILISLALSSNTMLGQVTSFDCNMNVKMYSSAIGYQTTALGYYSLASGYKVKAMADYSYIFGSVQSEGGQSIGITTNNTPRSFMLVFEGKPVVFAQLDATLSHRVGIGTVTPKASLDVDGTTRTGILRVINNTVQYTGQELSFYPVDESQWTSAPAMPTLFLKKQQRRHPDKQSKSHSICARNDYNGKNTHAKQFV